jgi:hypothetical protein
MNKKDEVFTAAKVFTEIISKGVDRDIVAKPSLATLKGKEVLLGVSRSKELLLMIPVSEDKEIAKPIESLTPTLDIVMLEKLDSGGNLQKFLTLQTSSSFDVTLFGAICDQAIIDLRDTSEIREMLRSIVNHWRKLLDSMNLDSLSKSKAIGLFGELLALGALQKSLGESALTSWVGPHGARNDFLFESAALEVKTTTRTDSLVAEVHGIDQFETVAEKTCWLMFVQIEWDPNGVSLDDLITSTRELFADKSKFDEKLKLIGIKPGGNVNSNFVFSKKQIYLDEVTDKFPFLHIDTVSTLIDIGRLRAIGYAVGLDGLCTEILETELTNRLSEIGFGC